MLKNKIYKAWVLLAAFALSSCHDELLNPVPESVLTTANAFNTANDLNLAVLGGYEPYKRRIQTDYALLEMGTDDMYAFYFGSTPGIEEITVLEVSPENPRINDFWKVSYNGIFRVNSVLANIDRPSDYSANQKEQYIGEAKFMRAMYYFDLVRVFGGVPAVTSVITNEEARVTPRASVDAIYNDIIIPDLKDAISKLPLPSAMPHGRASKAAAEALLAKVYVYRNNWTEARPLLENVLEDYGYNLVDDYASLFEVATEKNSEAIFSIPFVEGTDGQTLTYALSPIYGIHGVINNGNRVGRPTWDLHTAFEPEDSRFPVTIAEYQLTYDSDADDEPFWFPYFNKYIVVSQPNNSGLDIPVLRLADVVLLYAEVLYNLDLPDLAIAQINRVRERAFGNADHNYTVADIPNDDAFLDVLLLERRLELAVENNRWFDLVRTGRYLTELQQYEGEYNPGSGTAINIQVDVQDYKRYFPIPWEQIQLAAEGVLTQNDKYN